MGWKDDVSTFLRTLARTEGRYDPRFKIDTRYHITGADIRRRFGEQVSPQELEGFIKGLKLGGTVRDKVMSSFGTKERSVASVLNLLRDMVLKFDGTRPSQDGGAVGWGVTVHPDSSSVK